MDKKIIQSDHLSSVLSSNKGPVYVLNDASVSIKKGKVIGLIGESGSGKTQLLMALAGMQDLTPGVKEGKIYYYDESQNKKNYLPDFNNRKWSLEKTVDGNYKRLDEYNFKRFIDKSFSSIKKNKIGLIPQDPRTFLNPFWTLGTLFKESYAKIDRHQRSKFDSFDSFFKYYCERVGLKPEDVIEQFPHELSGGEAQRAMIAFVLSWHPDIIIGDECTTGLDVSRQKDIINLLKEIIEDSKQEGDPITVILISHDISFLHHLVDEYYVMYAGHVVEYISDKERMIDKDSLHPYTEDLLSSLLPDNKKDAKVYEELAAAVDLTKKPQGCPYKNSCKLINALPESDQTKCREMLPPEFNASKNEVVNLEENWKRCWGVQ